jgi:hypothetical protein
MFPRFIDKKEGGRGDHLLILGRTRIISLVTALVLEGLLHSKEEEQSVVE